MKETTTPKESWEERFDEKLGTYTTEYGYVNNIPKYNEIKSFISEVRKEAMMEVLNVADEFFKRASTNEQCVDFIKSLREQIEKGKL